MSITLTSKVKYFLKLVLPCVLLLQWTMPTLEKKRNIHINFSDIIIEKCNDPEHSHPPLSQSETPEDPEKLVNSNLDNSLCSMKNLWAPRFFCLIATPVNMGKFLPIQLPNTSHDPK